MLGMSRIERMRDMLADGYTPTEVRETLGASYPTIRKCAQEDDFSPQRPEAPEHPGKPDPCKALIGEMLEEDRRRCHKQRHTAKRVFERLRAEHGFSGGCSTARRHMKEIRPKGPRGESVRLGWGPGTMQAGFGQADFDYAFGGGRARMHHLPMPFPYSSHGVREVFAGEKDVCACQGLKDRFERIGGVPPSSCSTTPPRPGGGGATRPWGPTSSAGPGCATASRPASAARAPARRGETSRARSAAPGGTSSCPCPRWTASKATTEGLPRRSTPIPKSGSATRRDSAGPPSSRLARRVFRLFQKSPSASSGGRRARPTATEGSPWAAAIATWRRPRSHVSRSRWACAPSRWRWTPPTGRRQGPAAGAPASSPPPTRTRRRCSGRFR